VISALGTVARRLHAEAHIIDATATAVIDAAYVHTLRAAGVDAAIYTIANCSFIQGDLIQDDLVRAGRKLGAWFRRLHELRHDVGLATSVGDLIALRREGRVAVVFGMQNASPMEDDLDLLDLYYELGVRVVQVTYNAGNFLGAGSGDRRDAGLSTLGREAIRRMNELGVVIDIAHCGDRTTLEVIDASQAPVACTHANARTLADTPRNKPDAVLRALAATGGVVGIKHMLGTQRTKTALETTYRDVADHVDFMVNLMGIDHVCIGTDFRGTSLPSPTKDEELRATRRRWKHAYLGPRSAPAGFESIADLPNLTQELLERGYQREEIEKIYGGNVMRVLTQVFKT
jgi:membrane dipeptidase